MCFALINHCKSFGVSYGVRAAQGLALFAFMLFAYSVPAAFAQSVDASEVASNVVDSVTALPALVSALSYLLGLLLGVLGIWKLKNHVENPSQNELKDALIRFVAGGALLALPIVYEAMAILINGGEITENAFSGSIADTISQLAGGLSNVLPTLNINNILLNIIDAIEELPGLVSAVAYLLALVLGVSGVLKLRDHVENPQTEMKEGVVRLVAGGALFAMPTIFDAMYTLVAGQEGTGIINDVNSSLSALEWFWSSDAQSVACSPIDVPGRTLLSQTQLGSRLGISGDISMGNVVCNLMRSSIMLPAFLTALSYLFGVVLGFWGILKLRDHALDPRQNQIWDGLGRLAAGGMFFALPVVIEATRSTVTPDTLTAVSATATTTGFNDDGGGIMGQIQGFLDNPLGALFGTGGGSCGPGGLDVKLYCFMSDIFAPMTVLLNFFGFVAGVILIMIGISRLLKSAQDGAKAPLGLGTIMTFAAGGALISFNAILRAFSTSFFTSPVTFTYARLGYAEASGLTDGELAHVHNVFSAILKFVILVGLISFVRGIFIVRGVAEGDNQASMMAGMTHILGGALAVNLGPLLNAVQATLGITQFGVVFS